MEENEVIDSRPMLLSDGGAIKQLITLHLTEIDAFRFVIPLLALH